MRVTVYFEDTEREYQVDFMKLAKKLKITEAEVIKAVQDLLSKNG